MGKIVNILKSRGKIGAVGLMIVGLVHMVLVFMGKVDGTYEVGASTFFLGLSLLGIRGKMDPTA